MLLRKLIPEDAPLMLEWMHDPTVVEKLQTNFSAKTMEDCLHFIDAARDAGENLHLAVADNDGTYMGTVSLKHITGEQAEFAITVRAAAMGRGFARFAMDGILGIGLEELGLKRIYWCVSPENRRAVRFYDKNGYTRTDPEVLNITGYTPEQISAYIWYCVNK